MPCSLPVPKWFCIYIGASHPTVPDQHVQGNKNCLSTMIYFLPVFDESEHYWHVEKIQYISMSPSISLRLKTISIKQWTTSCLKCVEFSSRCITGRFSFVFFAGQGKIHFMFWLAICSLTVLSFYVLDKKCLNSGVSFALKAGLRIQIPRFHFIADPGSWSCSSSKWWESAITGLYTFQGSVLSLRAPIVTVHGSTAYLCL